MENRYKLKDDKFVTTSDKTRVASKPILKKRKPINYDDVEDRKTYLSKNTEPENISLKQYRRKITDEKQSDWEDKRKVASMALDGLSYFNPIARGVNVANNLYNKEYLEAGVDIAGAAIPNKIIKKIASVGGAGLDANQYAIKDTRTKEDVPFVQPDYKKLKIKPYKLK
jgi:hypothetical protein